MYISKLFCKFHGGIVWGIVYFKFYPRGFSFSTFDYRYFKLITIFTGKCKLLEPQKCPHNPEVVGSIPASATIKKQPFSPENVCFSNFLVVTKVTGPTTWGLFGVYASGGQCFSNFWAENDFWGKTTLLGESSGKLHSKW